MTSGMSGAISVLTPSSTSDMRSQENSQAKIDAVLNILQDVSIQSPSSHSGYVIVFSNTKMSPLQQPGICFRWFRESEGSFLTLDRSDRPFYCPTVDDIGNKIFVQCEDSFGLGCSKYLEVEIFGKYF
jgi:hypothetical protein